MALCGRNCFICTKGSFLSAWVILPEDEKILDVAQYIYDEYKRQSGENIDEMKLRKLLYFTQRESLAITNEPLFVENFEGWKYGPVSKEV